MLSMTLPAASRRAVGNLQRLARFRHAAARARLANPRLSGLYAPSPAITDHGAVNPRPANGFLCNAADRGIWHVVGGVHGFNANAAALRAGWVDAGRTFASELNTYARWGAVADCRYLTVRLAPSPVPYRFIVDDRYVSAEGTMLGTSGGGTSQYVTLDFGSRAIRRVTVEGAQASGCMGAYVEDDAAMWAYDTREIVHAVFLGDSYVQGAGPSQRGDGVAVQMADRMGLALHASGSGGTGWNHANQAAWRFDQRIAAGDLGMSYYPPEAIFLMASVNDRNRDSALVRANAQAGLAEARRQYPEVPIVVFGCIPAPAGPLNGSPSIMSSEQAVAEAVVAFADPLCRFVPIAADPLGAWVTGAGAQLPFTAPLAGATGGTLASAWPRATSSTLYTIVFSDGSRRLANFTTGSTAVTWSGAVTAGAAASVFQIEGNARQLFTSDWIHPSLYGAGYIAERYARAATAALEDMLQ